MKIYFWILFLESQLIGACDKAQPRMVPAYRPDLKGHVERAFASWLRTGGQTITWLDGKGEEL